MKTMKALLLATVAVTAILFATPSFAQTTTLAKLHGTVTDPTGTLLTKGDVKLTLDKSLPEKEQKFLYSFPIDANGAYKGADIKPGDYLIYVVQGDNRLDYELLTLHGTDDATLNFDMTRKEYMDSLSPEKKKEIEDFKKKQGAVINSNKVVATLNATLATVRADLVAAVKGKDDVSKDVDSMQQATAAKPDESILWLVYGDTLQAQGDHLAKVDKASGKPVTGDDVAIKDYTDAVDSYKKSSDLNAASKKPDPHSQSTAYNQAGNALAKAGKVTDAQAAYDNAVKIEPTQAGVYYGNEAAVLFNVNQMDGALTAANKAIAADPALPNPYFIKGQALIGASTLDAKTGKLVAPPGCIEAYQKYLELDPDGPQATSVKEILTSFGEKIDTSYKAGKKK